MKALEREWRHSDDMMLKCSQEIICVKADMERFVRNLESPVFREPSALETHSTGMHTDITEDIVRGVVACNEKTRHVRGKRARLAVKEWGDIFLKHGESMPSFFTDMDGITECSSQHVSRIGKL